MLVVMRRSERSIEESGPALIVVLLALSTLCTAVLAWQAVAATRLHRHTAERVVRDYERLAAGELLKRACTDIELYGFLPALHAESNLLDRRDPSASLPSLEELVASAANLNQRQGVTLPRYLLRAELRSGRVELSSEAPAGAAAAIERELAQAGAIERVQTDREVGFSRRPPPNMDQILVYGLHRNATGPESPILIGFVTDDRALTPYFGRAFARAPLLPRALGGGRLTNDVVEVRVTSPSGVELYRSDARFDSLLALEEPVDGDYDVAKGGTTRCAIDPAVTPSLIIGGLPSSRTLPLLFTLSLSAAFLLVAIRQLARDRELVRLRSDFVSSVSHELRTPLTQIRMFAETLKFDRVRSEEERRRSLEIIDQEVRRLTDLVENILSFSRGERGAIRIVREESDLVTLARETVERFVPISSESGARIRIESEPYLEALVDPDAMRQVLLNLLENAVRYGPPRQVIIVSVSGDEERIVLAVDDEGPGVPASDRDRVFRKFQRLERDRQRHQGGLGIGLAVVREIVALHGGTTSVENGSRGGARFVVEIPTGSASRWAGGDLTAAESSSE